MLFIKQNQPIHNTKSFCLLVKSTEFLIYKNSAKMIENPLSSSESHLLHALYSNKTNKEDFTLIWLDKTLDKDVNDSRQISKLCQAVDDLKTYVDLNECENYIRSIPEDDRMLLIVSGGLGQSLVPRIHMLRKILAIYIFCFDKKKYEEWSRQFEGYQSSSHRI